MIKRLSLSTDNKVVSEWNLGHFLSVDGEVAHVDMAAATELGLRSQKDIVFGGGRINFSRSGTSHPSAGEAIDGVERLAREGFPVTQVLQLLSRNDILTYAAKRFLPVFSSVIPILRLAGEVETSGGEQDVQRWTRSFVKSMKPIAGLNAWHSPENFRKAMKNLTPKLLSSTSEMSYFGEARRLGYSCSINPGMGPDLEVDGVPIEVATKLGPSFIELFDLKLPAKKPPPLPAVQVSRRTAISSLDFRDKIQTEFAQGADIVLLDVTYCFGGVLLASLPRLYGCEYSFQNALETALAMARAGEKSVIFTSRVGRPDSSIVAYTIPYRTSD